MLSILGRSQTIFLSSGIAARRAELTITENGVTVHDHLLDHGGLLDNNASVTAANISDVLNVTLAPLPTAETLSECSNGRLGL